MTIVTAMREGETKVFWNLPVMVALALSVCPSAAGQAASSKPSPTAHAVAEANLGVRDIGIFSDLDGQVQVALPRALTPERVHAAVDRARAQLVLYADDWPIKVYPLRGASALSVGPHSLTLRPLDRAELMPLLAVERLHVFEHAVELPPGDQDGDGIPDPLDISIGAHKTVLNGDHYDGRYQRLSFPNGDVPRGMGVCTDVIVRALRNAGCDLQRAVHDDIAASRAAYPMVTRPNPSIDHRRVKSLLPYFQRHFETHSQRLDDPSDPLRPGDIVLMDTFPNRPGAEHVGLISEVAAANGLPMVINNWTDGTRTSLMELLSWVPVTHRFRYPARLGVRGPISIWTTQLVVVTTDGWDERHARLTRYERTLGKAWRMVGAPRAAVIGHAGYAWGDGVHGSGAPAGRPGTNKREGDGRAPAGVFALGAVHGIAPDLDTRLSYQKIADDQVCIDDPASARYNRVVSKREGALDFRSAEPMRRDDGMYDLAIDIEHNRSPVVSGHGSCIFIHPWAGPDTRLPGCTGLAKADVSELARWLTPHAALLVALPSREYQALRTAWMLP